MFEKLKKTISEGKGAEILQYSVLEVKQILEMVKKDIIDEKSEIATSHLCCDLLDQIYQKIDDPDAENHIEDNNKLTLLRELVIVIIKEGIQGKWTKEVRLDKPGINFRGERFLSSMITVLLNGDIEKFILEHSQGKANKDILANYLQRCLSNSHVTYQGRMYNGIEYLLKTIPKNKLESTFIQKILSTLPDNLNLETKSEMYGRCLLMAAERMIAPNTDENAKTALERIIKNLVANGASILMETEESNTAIQLLRAVPGIASVQELLRQHNQLEISVNIFKANYEIAKSNLAVGLRGKLDKVFEFIKAKRIYDAHKKQTSEQDLKTHRKSLGEALLEIEQEYYIDYETTQVYQSVKQIVTGDYGFKLVPVKHREELCKDNHDYYYTFLPWDAADTAYELQLSAKKAFAGWEKDSINAAMKESLRDAQAKEELGKQLKKESALYGFSCHNVAMDGNCFFSAVAHQLKDHPELNFTQQDLRAKAVQHLIDYIHFYKGAIEGNVNAFFDKISKGGTWADHLIIQALSRALKITIVIIHSSGKPIIIRQEPAEAIVYLGYEAGWHYQSLVKIKLPAAESKSEKDIQSLVDQEVIDPFFTLSVDEKDQKEEKSMSSSSADIVNDKTKSKIAAPVKSAEITLAKDNIGIPETTFKLFHVVQKSNTLSREVIFEKEKIQRIVQQLLTSLIYKSKRHKWDDTSTDYNFQLYFRLLSKVDPEKFTHWDIEDYDISLRYPNDTKKAKSPDKNDEWFENAVSKWKSKAKPGNMLFIYDKNEQVWFGYLMINIAKNFQRKKIGNVKNKLLLQILEPITHMPSKTALVEIENKIKEEVSWNYPFSFRFKLRYCKQLLAKMQGDQKDEKFDESDEAVDYLGEYLSENSDSEDEINYNRLPNNEKSILKSYALKLQERSQVHCLYTREKELRKPDPKKAFSEYDRPKRQKVYRETESKDQDDIQRDLETLNAMALRGELIVDKNGKIKGIATPFFIALYRGIHYLIDCWGKEIRQLHRNKLEEGDPVFSSLAYHNAGHDFTSSRFLSEKLVDVLTEEGLEIEDRMLQLTKSGGIKDDSDSYSSNGLCFLQDKYSKGYTAFFNNLRRVANSKKAITRLEDAIYLSIGSPHNPFFSASDTPDHALRYAYGISKFDSDFRQSYILRPRYRKDGRVEWPYVGKIYISLHDPYELVSRSNHVPSLNHNGETPGMIHQIIAERETTFFGYIPAKKIVGHHVIKYPSFHGHYKNIYLKKYGMDKKLYDDFKGAFITNPPGSDLRKKYEFLLTQHLISYREVCLIEEARIAAQDKGGVLIYRNEHGGFSLLPCRTQTLTNVKHDMEKLRAAKESREIEKEKRKQPKTDGGFLVTLLDDFKIMGFPNDKYSIVKSLQHLLKQDSLPNPDDIIDSSQIKQIKFFTREKDKCIAKRFNIFYCYLQEISNSHNIIIQLHCPELKPEFGTLKPLEKVMPKKLIQNEDNQNLNFSNDTDSKNEPLPNEVENSSVSLPPLEIMTDEEKSITNVDREITALTSQPKTIHLYYMGGYQFAALIQKAKKQENINIKRERDTRSVSPSSATKKQKTPSSANGRDSGTSPSPARLIAKSGTPLFAPLAGSRSSSTSSEIPEPSRRLSFSSPAMKKK